MKITSMCERQFITDSILKKQKRLDGRQLLEARTLEIVFSKDGGCCMVLRGNTRILAEVSCEITEPKASAPTEGVFHVNFELSAMAAPDMKLQTRSSEETVEAQRCLERCVRDSKCIDLESLCIVTGSKVWTIKVNIHTLNDDGNVIECASIAALSALAHFRRPDVTVVGTDVTVHSIEEREPVALNLHHMPISVNLALFDQGKYILIDPTEIEERIADGCYVIGMNAHQEICFVHRRGVLLLKEEAIRRCEDLAVKHAQEVTQSIRKALDDDAYKRATNILVGFTNLIQTGMILGAKRPIAEFSLDSVRDIEENTEPDIIDLPEGNEENINLLEGDMTSQTAPSIAKERAMRILQESEVSVFEGGPSKWGVETDDESSEEGIDIKPNVSSMKEEIDLDSEEETVYVNKDQVDMKLQSSRGWYSKDPFAPSVAEEPSVAVHNLQKSTVSVFEEGPSKRSLERDDETSEEVNDGKPSVSAVKGESNLDDDDDEEIVYISKDQVDMKMQKSRGWYSKDPFA